MLTFVSFEISFLIIASESNCSSNEAVIPGLQTDSMLFYANEFINSRVTMAQLTIIWLKLSTEISAKSFLKRQKVLNSMFETSTPKYLQIPNFSEISEFGSYEHLKFRSMRRLKYRPLRHNHVIVVTSPIFCYHCIEYIKLDTCVKFHDYRSNNNKAMMGGGGGLMPPSP